VETNDAGINLIKEFEGLRTTAYRDVAGIWTVGYGHIRDVVEGMVVSVERAVGLLKDDLKATEEGVTRAIGNVPTTPNQFAAMVALAFNIGVNAFKNSTVLREHLAGNNDQSAQAFLMWDKATINGKLTPVAGLKRRREAEAELYMTA
jgi:lysozyme